MATKTITNTNRFVTRKDTQSLLGAMKSASAAKQMKIVYSKKVKSVASVDVKKYADKF